MFVAGALDQQRKVQFVDRVFGGVDDTPSSHETDEQRLWTAVIVQAFMDATEPLPVLPASYEAWRDRRRKWVVAKGRPEESEIAEREAWMRRKEGHDNVLAHATAAQTHARRWLLVDKTDFLQVCRLANKDPHRVRDAAKRMESEGWPVIQVET